MADAWFTQDRDLLELAPRILPPSLPTETLYSWCARFHRLSCNANIRTTSRWLFGHPTSGLRHDFPTRLDHFCEVTRNYLGSSLDVIYERTQFGLFAPFLSQDVRDQMVAAMCVANSHPTGKRLGIHRSGMGSSPIWKVCRDCLEEEIERIPPGGWNLLYQYPSVWYCPKHQVPLSWRPDSENPRAPTTWHLPADSVDSFINTAIGSNQHDILASLTSWTAAITAARTEFFDKSLLRYTYLLRAKELGWVAMDGSLRLHLLRNTFRQHYAELVLLPGMQFLDTTKGVNGGFLGQLVRDYAGARHPVKHLLLMALLFDTPSQFREAYAASRETETADGVGGLHNQLKETQHLLRKLVVNDARSVNSACLELGIPPTQAIRHLRKTGLPYRKRPRILSDALRAELNARLMAGEAREQIAAVLGIRKSFIKDYLAGKEELRTAWEKAHGEKLLSRYRAHFLQILADHPGIPIRQIKRIKGNGFAWLHKNDRDWLTSHLPGFWNRVK